jgi:hypothetical protein
MQLCSDMLEHLDLSGLDDMSGDRDVCSAGHMCRNSDLWRVHDMLADAGMRAATLQLPVPW